MCGMKDKIRQAINEALRKKDALRLSVLRMVSAAMHNREIEKKTKSGISELSEDEVVTVLRSEVKKRKDAIVEYKKGDRSDLVEKEVDELKILEEYLPPEISEEELEKVVKEVLVTFDQVDEKSFGRVMGEVMKRVKGQASGDRVSEAVKKLLT